MLVYDYIEGTWISRKFIEPMGYLTIWFSLLEKEVDRAIWSFLELDEFTGTAVTAQFISMRIKLEMLLAIIDLRGEESDERKHLHSVVESVQAASAKRNEYIHGVWVASLPQEGEHTAIKVSSKAREKLHHTTAKFTAKSVMLTAHSALRLSGELSNAVRVCPRRKTPKNTFLELIR